MRVDFRQCSPVFSGQTHNAVADAELMFTYDRSTAVAQEFVVMEQASGDGIFYGNHPDNIAVVADRTEHFFERVAANQLYFFVVEVFVGGNIVV